MYETDQIQLRTRTAWNRYPKVFRLAYMAARLSRPGGARVLSFGCSEGVECQTLASIYFNTDQDKIVGVDVDRVALATAKANNRSSRISLVHADDFAKDQSQFDAIFAMSVLCVWPLASGRSIRSRFPFSTFQSICSDLDKRLAVGGVLTVYDASYCFADLAMASRYDAYGILDGNAGFVRRHTPNGDVLKDKYADTVFVKRAQ